MPETPQLSELEILNDGDRIFKGIITADVVDKDNEITNFDDFVKSLNTFMDRGGALNDSHTNKVIGKVLNFEKTKLDGDIDAVEITGKIHDDYAIDDEAWNKIKSKMFKGLSYGGKKTGPQEMKGSVPVLNGVQVHEMSVCEQGANPLAQITEVNYLAKSESANNSKGGTNMAKKIKKQEEMPEAPSEEAPAAPEEAVEEVEDAVEETATSMGDLMVAVEALTEEVKSIKTKMEEDEAEEEVEKPEDEEEKAAEIDEDVELPKDQTSETEEADAEADDDTVLSTKTLQKMIKKEIRKSLNKTGSTPRGTVEKSNEIMKANSNLALDIVRGNGPKDWGELNKMVKQQKRQDIAKAVGSV